MYISVCGSGEPDPQNENIAYEAGVLIARRNAILICGGLGAVMDAAARGAKDAGGTSIGILPGFTREGASKNLTYSITTGLGEARNTLIARSADALIAIGGEFGTLSEIAFALKLGTPVIGVNTWHLQKDDKESPSIARAKDAKEAVELAFKSATE